MTQGIKLISKLIIVPRRETMKLGEKWIIYLLQDYSKLWRNCGYLVLNISFWWGFVEGVIEGFVL